MKIKIKILSKSLCFELLTGRPHVGDWKVQKWWSVRLLDI